MLNELMGQLQRDRIYVTRDDILDSLLKAAEVIYEQDTKISDFIRILKYKNYYVTQEITDKKELVLRLFESYREALDLVNDHLETYDKMWDGCGCRVNYYS